MFTAVMIHCANMEHSSPGHGTFGLKANVFVTQELEDMQGGGGRHLTTAGEGGFWEEERIREVS